MKKFLAILFSVVIIATFMAVPAFAEVSPEGEVVHKVEIKGGDTQQVKDGESVTLKVEDDDKDFEKWVIIGEYKIVSGDLNSKELVIIPESDLVVEKVFKTPAADEDKEENKSDTSAPTGNGTLMVTVLLTAGAFVAMVASKKSVKA